MRPILKMTPKRGLIGVLMSPEYQIGALWVDGPLSFLEQLCLKSFVDAGHHTILYRYGNVTNIPEGVEVRDANEVLPLTGFLTHERTGSPALHSDLFRYKMLETADRMIWADTDAYCVKAFETPNGHFYGWESEHHVNGGVLGLPPDSETLRELLEFTSDEFAIPPWYEGERLAEYEAAAARGEPIHAGDMRWGVWGPHAVTHFLHKTGEIKYALPRRALYPFSFKERRRMLRRNTKMEEFVFDDTYSIHFYGRRMRKRIAEAEGGRPKHWSPIGQLMKKHGIVAEHGPIPGSPLAEEMAANPVAVPPPGQLLAPAPKVRVPSVDVSELADDKILILTAMKNEGPFILDWIGYCQSLGVDHFLVYTNDCDDGTVEILERLAEMGLVTHLDNPFNREKNERPQWVALADAKKQPVLQNADWVIFIDIDEYMNIHVEGGTLRHLLAEAGNPDLLSMTWRFYGCGGVVDFVDEPVAAQFLHAAPEYTRKPHHNWGFKTILSNRVNFGKLGVHRPGNFPDQPILWVNGSGYEMPEKYHKNGWRSSKDSWGYEMVTLNHYATRSIESFLVKRDRGRVNHINRDQGLEYWSVFNRNDEKDRAILPAIERAQPFVDKLKADETLAHLHEGAVAWHRAKIDELKERPAFLELYHDLSKEPLKHDFDLTEDDGKTVRFAEPPKGVAEQTKTVEGPTPAPKRKTAKPAKDVDAEPLLSSAGDVILTGSENRAAFETLESRMEEKFPRLAPLKSMPAMNKVLAVTLMANEGPFALEWIAYHKSIGVTDFLIYTVECDEATGEVLDALQATGSVTHVDLSQSRKAQKDPQRAMLNDAAGHALVTDCDWYIVLEADEFIDIHVGDGSLASLVDAAGHPNILSMTQRMFGNDGIVQFEADTWITDRFTRCAPELLPRPRNGWGIKSLVQNGGAFQKLGANRPLKFDESRQDEVRWVNGSGRVMPEKMMSKATSFSRNETVGYQLVTLNKYPLRSADSFLVTSAGADEGQTSAEQAYAHWAAHNYRTETDERIKEHLPRARRVYDDLIADERVLRAHASAIEWHRERSVDLRSSPEYADLYETITAREQPDAIHLAQAK